MTKLTMERVTKTFSVLFLNSSEKTLELNFPIILSFFKFKHKRKPLNICLSIFYKIIDVDWYLILFKLFYNFQIKS
jgi:hypothetical protein